MDSKPREKIETPDGVEIRPTYGSADGAVDYLRDLGFPGEYPFTRGIYPTMYRGRLWTMRQYAGFGTAEESNRRFRYLLGQGQTGLSIAFDLPTQMGYDSDHPMAEPEVGKVGVAIDSLLDMEVLLDGIAPGLSFFFAAQMNLLEEVAKFRAARRLWARIVRERFGAADPRSWMLRFHTQTAGAALTAQQPANNVVRVALQALAAVLGGTQSLHTNARDEALALPTDEAALLALRTQQIIASESGVADTVDPLAGAYYIEALTTEIERRAETLIRQVEDAGGVLRALEAGLMQRLIAESAYREARRVETGEQVVVGVNRFQSDEAGRPSILRVPPEVLSRQKARLAQARRARNHDEAQRALMRLRRAAGGTENLMPHILAAVQAYATIGEICDTLRTVFGVYKPTAVI